MSVYPPLTLFYNPILGNFYVFFVQKYWQTAATFQIPRDIISTVCQSLALILDCQRQKRVKLKKKTQKMEKLRMKILVSNLCVNSALSEHLKCKKLRQFNNLVKFTNSSSMPVVFLVLFFANSKSCSGMVRKILGSHDAMYKNER